MPIAPEMLAAKGDEHSHQKAFFQYVSLTISKRYPDALMAHAVPNGAKLRGQGTDEGQREGNRMKAEGLRPGVPDIFVPVPLREYSDVLQTKVVRYPGLWIEMKRPGRANERDGGRSPEQVTWQGKLLKQGYAVVTAYGWQATAVALAMYLSGALVMPDGGDCYFAVDEDLPPW